jgi:hypothetical protein
MPVRYLTGSSGPAVRVVAREAGLGLLIQPMTKQYRSHIPDYALWAADNGCFTTAGTFDEGRWWQWLVTMADEPGCLFATAPDVVGEAQATLDRSAPWLPLIRDLGYPAALVAQDGLEKLPVPWDDFDVLFIGGSTEWKLGQAAARLTLQAKNRGKHVHMGRVNSGKRLRHADSIGCDTADGTYLAFGPNTNLPRLLRWLDQLETAA